MALNEKISQEDLIVYEILKHPVFFGEFVANFDKMDYEEHFKFDWYQVEFMCDFAKNVSMACGRAVGKTESLAWLLIWSLVMNIFPNDYIIYTVPNKVHLEPVFSRMTRFFRSNSFLKNFLRPSGGINNAEYIIDLQNNAKLICRIAGTSGTGANVIGLHSPFEILDEAGYYPWGTWIELQPTMNSWTPGNRLIVSGVPTGLRERNVLYTCDMEDSSFTKHRISALQNPRFSEDDKQKALDQYGGEDSDDYIHLVLGQHGRPLFSLFDRSQFDIQNYPLYKLVLNGTQLSENLSEYINKIAILPGIPDRDAQVIFGIDLGYTEPTAIVILYLDRQGRLKFHARIKLEKVSYTIQDRFIDALDTKFRPALIGIDEGGVGKPVVQRLLEDHEFIHKDYSKRLTPINFSQNIVLGMTSDGEEIKTKSKPLSVSILQEYSNNHKVIYTSTDLEMVTELERMTYTKTPTGDIVYKTLTERGGKKGEDHFTAALLCAILSYYLQNEALNYKKGHGKLASSFWLTGN